MNGDVLEGFLCPICMKDLGTINQLQRHFEENHRSLDDSLVLQHLKGLFDKAKKKFLNDEPSLMTKESSSPKKYVNLNKITSDPPQEIGKITSHTVFYKTNRDKRIDCFALETNKLLLRLDKLIDENHATLEPNKRKNYEKSVVPWMKDSEMPNCKSCKRMFTIARRRHHCRLCGSIMCGKCSLFLSFEFAKKLTNPSFEVDDFSVQGFRRSNSSGSLNSLFSSDGESHIRTCSNCSILLERRNDQMETRNTIPTENVFYSKLVECKKEAERLLPKVVRMAQSLRDGDESISLDQAEIERGNLLLLFDNIDKLSKKIALLEEEGGPKVLQLRKSIRMAAAGWLQENMIGLQSLPTREQLIELKKRKDAEFEKRIAAEKQNVIVEKKIIPDLNLTLKLNEKSVEKKLKENGWTPETTVDDHDDPMIQQINIIKNYIKQAKKEGKKDEVEMLEENLKQLEKAFWLKKDEEVDDKNPFSNN